MSDELPQGWVWAKMLDILDYEGGSQPPKKIFAYEPRAGYVRLLQIRDFGDKPFPTYVPDSHRLKKATRNDLLLARYGGSSGSDSLGRICTGLDGAYNVALAKLIFSHEFLERDYVRYLFLGPWFREKVSQNSRSCQTGFNRDDVENISFPLPPLLEQRRIVAKLEAVLAKVDAFQRRLAKIPLLLKRFRQSVLVAACSGRLTVDWRDANPEPNPASGIIANIIAQSGKPISESDPGQLPFTMPTTWHCIQAQDLCRPKTIITYGILKPVWVEYGVPTVRVQDMQKGKISIDAIGRCSHERACKFLKTSLESGDLLIAKDGATLGKTAFVPPELAGGNITQHVLRFPITQVVEPVFVRMVIDSQHGQDWMRAETKGVALPGVNVRDFRRMPIPLPPLPEQQEIVRRVESLFALADQLEARYAKAQVQVDKLTPSLLAKAFRGELVPQDPNDEPAAKLLERIKENRGKENE